MKKTIGWLALVILAFGPCAMAYTVIQKNGKHVEGELIRQTDAAFILKDKSGVELRFQKSSLDMEATSAANDESQTPVVISSSEKTPPSTQTAPAKQPVRKYTQDDLDSMPEVSVMGSQTEPLDAHSGERRERMDDARSKRTKMLREQLDAAVAECEKMNATTGIPLPARRASTLACERAERLKQALDGESN